MSIVRKVAIISADTGASEDWNTNYCGMVLITGEADEVAKVIDTADFNYKDCMVDVSIDSETPEEDAVEIMRKRFPNLTFEHLGTAGAVILNFVED
jgi:hypothetical protein